MRYLECALGHVDREMLPASTKYDVSMRTQLDLGDEIAKILQRVPSYVSNGFRQA